MIPVSSEAVASYKPLIETAARRFARLEVPLAESDDLMQIGLIRVWRMLQRGQRPNYTAIANAMIDELRRVSTESDSVSAVPGDLEQIDAEYLAVDGASV